MRLIVVINLLSHFISLLLRTNAFSMTMLPIDSPHLKLLPESFTDEDRHQFLRNLSRSRALNFNKKDSKLGPNSIEYPLGHVHLSYFLIQLRVGTSDPPYDPLVVLDMKSKQTWFQCAQCDPCFDLDRPYNPLDSLSFAKLTLDDDRCNPKKSYQGTCSFESDFGDAHTDGYMGTDTFSFANTDGNVSYFPNIAFGCGIHNIDFDWPDNAHGKIAGVHGFGTGPKSFMSQLVDETQGRFSYCIPREKGDTIIKFGEEAQIGKGAKKIPMEPDFRYHLHLEHILLANAFIVPTLGAFNLDKKNYKTGFFIDPNTPNTVINTVVYLALVAELGVFFEKAYKWKPIPSVSTDVLDLCYNHEASRDQYPSVTLVFKGFVGFTLDTESVFKHRPFPLQGFCLNIEHTLNGPSIFGAYEQANHNFLFDINAKALYFTDDGC